MMNITVKRTDSTNQDFITLVQKLDAFLSIQNGESDAFYSQYNGLENLKNTIVIYNENTAIGCGAFKKYNDTTVEIKRMYVDEVHQGKAFGNTILIALEDWAKELGFTTVILETGTMLPEAIRFYEKNQYQRIPNYAPYEHMPESVCFEKKLC